MTTIDLNDNVHQLRAKKPYKADPDAPLTIVQNYGKCRHLHVEVDEKLAEVTCSDCKERLNPMHVLVWLSQLDSQLRMRWSRTQAALELMQQKTRCKCQHCGRMTPIPTGVSDWKLSERASEIAKGEGP